MIHNLYIAQKLHILQKSNTSIHKEQNVSTLHIHGSVQYPQKLHEHGYGNPDFFIW